MAKGAGEKKKRGRKKGDFLAPVRLELAKRVNFHCSICDAQTVGPKTDNDKSFSVGKAAHIKAAAPGGPRYDEEQSPEDRRSIGNGIYCCSTCADIVDYDMNAYSVTDLLALKDKAERRARERLGQRPASQTFTPRTRSEIERAVAIYCLTEAERQELLDPRFSVSVTWSDGGPVYELKAKESVDTRVIVRGKDKQTTITALRDMFDYGGSQSFEGSDIRLEGSPLFADSDGVVKQLKIATQAQHVTMTVVIGDQVQGSVFVEFACQMGAGQKGLRIKGAALDGLIEVELTCDRATKAEKFTLHFDLQRWAGKPLLRVPHFAKLRQIARAMGEKTPIRLHLTSNGDEVELGSGTLDVEKYHLYLEAFVQELEFLRKIDAFFSLNLAVPDDVHEVLRCAGNGDELLALVNIHEAEHAEVQGELIPTAPLDGLIAALRDSKPGPIQLQQKVELRIFDRTYGPYEVDVVCANAVVIPVGPAIVEVGAPLPITMRGVDGHRWIARYKSAA